jgi:hypothetical protein
MNLNAFALLQGQHFDLQALLAGVVYQSLKSCSHIVRNPICPTLRTDGRRNMTDDHHAKTQFDSECRRTWMLCSPAQRAGTSLASRLHVALLVFKSASKWTRSGSYAVITNTCAFSPSKAARIGKLLNSLPLQVADCMHPLGPEQLKATDMAPASMTTGAPAPIRIIKSIDLTV